MCKMGCRSSKLRGCKLWPLVASGTSSGSGLSGARDGPEASVMLCYVMYIFRPGGPKLSTIAAVLILARIIRKAFCVGAVYMLERFLYSSPQKAPLYS
ncbi:Uncharacterized protein HZ326_31526 [Fusarium oxysporum f. sp. albedinis]|nr:Uncharacterized protein HZ326_31526 [Fusarium oxysporum f. sp. albedinis]